MAITGVPATVPTKATCPPPMDRMGLPGGSSRSMPRWPELHACSGMSNLSVIRTGVTGHDQSPATMRAMIHVMTGASPCDVAIAGIERIAVHGARGKARLWRALLPEVRTFVAPGERHDCRPSRLRLPSSTDGGIRTPLCRKNFPPEPRFARSRLGGRGPGGASGVSANRSDAKEPARAGMSARLEGVITMAVVTMRQLLESGVHFGHQTRRWNPKMKRFIITERNGIYIIDLQQSLSYIDQAYEYVKETVAHGGSIMFVGTKKQGQEAIADQATRVGMPYVNQRWLGGMLTNFSTVFKRLQRMKELEVIDFNDVAGSGLTKKELLVLRREKDKLEKTLGGIRDMSKIPSAIWVVDTKKEHIAVGEARKLGIPVIAVLDTNCDPDEVDFPIPGNDDAIRSVALLTRVIADAVAEGLMARASRAAGGAAAPEPLAEWEREMLAGSAEAAAALEVAAVEGSVVEGSVVEDSGVIEVVEETATPSEA